MCYVFTHLDYVDDDGPVEVYCCLKHARCDVEGDPDYFFDHLEPQQVEVTAGINREVEDGERVPPDLPTGPPTVEEIQRIRNMGIIVDDDNEPLPDRKSVV